MDSPIKVVVVDDNACMLWGLKHLIDAQEHSMLVADTVSRRGEVLCSVRQHQPDVVLLEMEVEGQSGLELISLVNEGCAAKIIVFTGVRNPALQEKAILAGAHGLVLKSEPVDVVLRAIKAVHAGELWLKRDVTARILGIMAAAYHQSSAPLCNSQFTPSENRVIAAAVKYRGAPNKVIADVLHMSPNTFRNHLSTIYAKLGIHRRLDLVLYGIQQGTEEHPDVPMSGPAMTGVRSMRLPNAARKPVQEPHELRGPADDFRAAAGNPLHGPPPDTHVSLAFSAPEGRSLGDSPVSGLDAALRTRAQGAASVAVAQRAPVRLIKVTRPPRPPSVPRR